MHSVKQGCPNFFHWTAKTETQLWATSQNQHLLCCILNMQNGPKCHGACRTQIMENSNYGPDVFKEHFYLAKKKK